ncbi:MAG: T9SS type A sorting domain-containing protein, partial [Candidatus Latescibacteria bacterium]|nr:T9SS type A sorting domain-containing protein [Candidatus Latescibacterota bacterium]
TRATTSLSSEDREFTVEFSVENVTELRGYGLTLDYDSQSLEFLGATAGEDNLLNKAAGATPLFLVVSNPDKPGQVWIANAVSDSKLAKGEGLLASLSFRTRSRPSDSPLPITFSAVELFDAQLHLNSVSAENLMKQLQLVPGQNRLAQNYPNPFNAVTCISYQLAQPAFVTLKVYNLSGQLVKMLVKENKPAGWHSERWDGRNSSGRTVASGIYFYHFTASEFSKVRKMLLLK